MSVELELKLRNLCLEALEKEASEIYLLIGANPFLRINGKIVSLSNSEIISQSFVLELKDFLLQEKKEEYKNQIIFVYNLEKIGNIEITIIQGKNGPAIFLKFLDKEIEDLSKTDLPQMVINFTNLKQGIIFVTGPKDSGKATLVASLIDYINKHQSKFISTLEKPIKYKFKSQKSLIEQREVGKDVSSFHEGLQYVKKRNIDVLMISEIEDKECLNELFSIAERGTLIFAITYFDTSINLIRHFLHFYSKEEEERVRYFFAKSFGGTICVRLIPRIGGGRIRALEVLPPTTAVKTSIEAGKFYQLTTILQSEEAISLDRYLADLVTSGEILPEEGMKAAIDQDILRNLLAR